MFRSLQGVNVPRDLIKIVDVSSNAVTQKTVNERLAIKCYTHTYTHTHIVGIHAKCRDSGKKSLRIMPYSCALIVSSTPAEGRKVAQKHSQKLWHAQTCKQKTHLQLRQANRSQTQPANSISRITSLAPSVSPPHTCLCHPPPTSPALPPVKIKTQTINK